MAQTDEMMSEMVEKFTIGAEYRDHDLIDVQIEQRMCLVCLKIQYFGVSHERDREGRDYLYKYCIGGKHHTIREALRSRH